MEDYSQFSDEQLQKLSAAGDKRAEELLVARYEALAESMARGYRLAGGDSSDLI